MRCFFAHRIGSGRFRLVECEDDAAARALNDAECLLLVRWDYDLGAAGWTLDHGLPPSQTIRSPLNSLFVNSHRSLAGFRNHWQIASISATLCRIHDDKAI